jgi:hypothetical protein
MKSIVLLVGDLKPTDTTRWADNRRTDLVASCRDTSLAERSPNSHTRVIRSIRGVVIGFGPHFASRLQNEKPSRSASTALALTAVAAPSPALCPHQTSAAIAMMLQSSTIAVER